MSAALYLNQARRAVGISQRELARRSGIPQPSIARIEGGHQIPRYDTLLRLLEACSFELRLGPKRGDGVDMGLIEQCLAMTPPERLERARTYGRFLERLRRAKPVSKAS